MGRERGRPFRQSEKTSGVSYSSSTLNPLPSITPTRYQSAPSLHLTANSRHALLSKHPRPYYSCAASYMILYEKKIAFLASLTLSLTSTTHLSSFRAFLPLKLSQAIAVASWYLHEGPLLVVCPASLRLHWAEQLERWLPQLRPHQIHLGELKTLAA